MDRKPTELEECRRALEQSQARNLRLIDFMSTASDSLWETDSDLRVNGGFRVVWADGKAGLVGVEREILSAVDGKTLLEAMGGATVPEAEWLQHTEDIRARRPYRGFVCPIKFGDGIHWLESSGNPVFDDAGHFAGYRGTTRDITRRKEDEALIAFMAQHDPLTGVPNRKLLREKIQHALTGVTPEAGMAVLYLDLDRFKTVNDTLGHPVGDSLLRAVAERLTACLRSIDTVARLGGDEFAIVQTAVRDREQVSALAGRITSAIAHPFDIDGHHIPVVVTLGIARAPADGDSPDVLMRNADIALYQAKAEQPGGWLFFEAGMGARLDARRELEKDLRAALARDQFEVFYQPLCDVGTRRVTGFEALLRWHHPDRGLVTPDEFIPIAEDTGLIESIGAWVLGQACADAARWPDSLHIAINLSPVQFKSPTLVTAVRDALGKSGLPARRLELEITEAVLMQNSEATLKALNELRALGATIALDDFGTGYSSLSYLRSFPFDKIKIDRSFIMDMTKNEGAAAIVRAIAALGTSLNLTTTAEGVETEEQFALVQSEGYTEAQGYLFSKPQPAAEIDELLAQIAARDKQDTGESLDRTRDLALQESLR